MNRTQKQEAVTSLTASFANAQAAYLVDYKGCTCQELTGIRRKLGANGVSLAVTKNSLIRRAIADTDAATLDDLLVGPTALVLSEDAIVEPAKILAEYAKDIEAFELKGGFVDGNKLSVSEIQELAKMPSKNELLSKLLSLFNAPATQLVRVMNAPATDFVRLLGAWKGKLEEGGGEEKTD